MFEGWGEFYLMAGSAAAVLIGLIFVVITLLQDRPRSSVLGGTRLYMGPIVLSMGFVLALSAAALTPDITYRQVAIVTGVVAVWGLARGIMSTVGIQRLSGEDKPHWTDVWFYGVTPSVLFLMLGGITAGLWNACEWSEYGLAIPTTGLLLLAVRNEWDLVTWIAPRSDKPQPTFRSIDEPEGEGGE